MEADRSGVLTLQEEEWILQCLKIAKQEVQAACRKHKGINQDDLLSYCNLVITRHWREIREGPVMRQYIANHLQTRVRGMRRRVKREDKAARAQGWRGGNLQATPLVELADYQQALTGMTRRQEMTFVLTYIGGYTQEEIAAMTELSQSAVNKYLQQAQEHAKNYFEKSVIKNPLSGNNRVRQEKIKNESLCN